MLPTCKNLKGRRRFLLHILEECPNHARNAINPIRHVNPLERCNGAVAARKRETFAGGHGVGAGVENLDLAHAHRARHAPTWRLPTTIMVCQATE